MRKNMVIILIVLTIIMMVGCSIPDVAGINKAHIKLPGNESREIDLQTWFYLDSKGSRMLLIDTEGTPYIVSSYNVTLTNADGGDEELPEESVDECEE